MSDKNENAELTEIPSPWEYINEYPLSKGAAELVATTRNKISKLIQGHDDRLLVIIGPCSISDVKSAKEYAKLLSFHQKSFSNELIVVMRTYLEKPRTTFGWKGFISDPFLNDSYDIKQGIASSRALLSELLQNGVAVAAEFLSNILVRYYSDMVSWGSIGARTVESQLHREMVSHLNCPIGFKNRTDGDLQVAINAIITSRKPHSFISISKFGKVVLKKTAGNLNSHLVLRGGKEPNFHAKNIFDSKNMLLAAGLVAKVVVDCSHANSQNDHKKQVSVAQTIAEQISSGNENIFGVMLESNLYEGRQDIKKGQSLEYGVSVTDACLGWKESLATLEMLSSAVKNRRKHKNYGLAIA